MEAVKAMRILRIDTSIYVEDAVACLLQHTPLNIVDALWYTYPWS